MLKQGRLVIALAGLLLPAALFVQGEWEPAANAQQVRAPTASSRSGAPRTVGGSKAASLTRASSLLVALQLDSVPTGYARTTTGRVFLPLSHIDGSRGSQLAEWVNGKAQPFPDAAWNSWAEGEDGADKFVHVNAVRIGPDGALWVVDVGAPGVDAGPIVHGPKIVRIDLATKVIRVFALDGSVNALSRIDDVRFHKSTAYITDAGSPGIIVLDLQGGSSRRVLDNDASVTAQSPVTVDEQVVHGPQGGPVKLHADQLEVSPDGRFLFYQPATGPMSRISTRYLDDPKLSWAELTKHVTTFSKTGSTGGTAIDDQGTIYASNTDDHRINAIAPDGSQRLLVQDPRLLWVDAMWLDAAGWLYMPAAQLDRMAPFNKGVSRLTLPITVFKMKVGGKPPASDHP